MIILFNMVKESSWKAAEDYKLKINHVTNSLINLAKLIGRSVDDISDRLTELSGSPGFYAGRVRALGAEYRMQTGVREIKVDLTNRGAVPFIPKTSDRVNIILLTENARAIYESMVKTTNRKKQIGAINFDAIYGDQVAHQITSELGSIKSIGEKWAQHPLYKLKNRISAYVSR